VKTFFKKLINSRPFLKPIINSDSIAFFGYIWANIVAPPPSTDFVSYGYGSIRSQESKFKISNHL